MYFFCTLCINIFDVVKIKKTPGDNNTFTTRESKSAREVFVLICFVWNRQWELSGLGQQAKQKINIQGHIKCIYIYLYIYIKTTYVLYRGRSRLQQSSQLGVTFFPRKTQICNSQHNIMKPPFFHESPLHLTSDSDQTL